MRPSLVAFVVLVLSLSMLVVSCSHPQDPTLEVSPTARTLVAGQGVQLTVTRRFAGGPLEDVTAKVTYTTSDRTLASVVDRGIVVAGNGNGSVIIRVFDEVSDASAAATFTIVPASIASIDVSPPTVALKKGQKRQFAATAHMNNGTIADVTGQVLWTSTNELAASVGNTASDKGLVSSVATGETDILATDAQTGVQGRSVVFVSADDTAPQLKAIVVTPNPGVVAVGKTLSIQALGVLSDGSTQDLTRFVAWKSSRPDLAAIDAVGLATGVATGDTTVTATGAPPNDAVKGSAALRVTP